MVTTRSPLASTLIVAPFTEKVAAGSGVPVSGIAAGVVVVAEENAIAMVPKARPIPSPVLAGVNPPIRPGSIAHAECPLGSSWLIGLPPT